MSLVATGLSSGAIAEYTRALLEVHARLATDHTCMLTRRERAAHAVPIRGLRAVLVRLRGDERYRVLETSEAAVLVVDHVLGASS